MAITLDELLGMNTNRQQKGERIDSFPSYDEFPKHRQSVSEPQQVRPNYEYTILQRSAPRTAESIRDYEASRPYVRPNATEYQSANYDYQIGEIQRRRENEYNANNFRTVQYAEPQTFTRREERAGGLHEFTRQDNDRPSEKELFERLNGGTVATHSYADDERTSTFTRVKSEGFQKKRPHLNTKGKVLLGVYLAVIILVAVLIVVNAGSLNNGTATMPSASKNAVSIEMPQSHISVQDGVDFTYGVGHIK